MRLKSNNYKLLLFYVLWKRIDIPRNMAINQHITYILFEAF